MNAKPVGAFDGFEERPTESLVRWFTVIRGQINPRAVMVRLGVNADGT